jgi:hypothetical protein
MPSPAAKPSTHCYEPSGPGRNWLLLTEMAYQIVELGKRGFIQTVNGLYLGLAYPWILFEEAQHLRTRRVLTSVLFFNVSYYVCTCILLFTTS